MAASMGRRPDERASDEGDVAESELGDGLHERRTGDRPSGRRKTEIALPTNNMNLKLTERENTNQERPMTLTASKAETKDPICGMTVDETTALHAERDGKTFYFCSDHCRQQFLSTHAGAKPGGKSGGCC
jgi:YHS domain-containing protein